MNYTKTQQYIDIINILYTDWKEFHDKETETFTDTLPYNPLKEKLTLNPKKDEYFLKD